MNFKKKMSFTFYHYVAPYLSTMAAVAGILVHFLADPVR